MFTPREFTPRDRQPMPDRLPSAIVFYVLVLSMVAPSALATGVPIGGFLPLVGLGLTDKFQDQLAPTFFQALVEPSLAGNPLGTGGSPYYDLALLDTGAAVSLITSAADAAFDIQGAGFRGTETLTVGGATGLIETTINDPLAMFVTGAANFTGTAPLTVNTSTLVGQSSVSVLTLPPESDLPNVVGIPLLSQYATFIRSDQPQIFQYNGKTVRTPQIDFLPLGSGGQGITRRAPLQLGSNTGAAFLTAPTFVFNIDNIGSGAPLTENPTAPTILQEPGAFFLSVDIENEGNSLNNFDFFFDTGADVTVVSQLNAVRLGFDPVLDVPDFTVAVSGSAGLISEVPGFFIEEFTIQAIGGSITATNVPVIVLDIPDPTDPVNFVAGIVGTNLLAGRNVVIDPIPAIQSSGDGPSLYISDPITSEFNWSTASASSLWTTASNWSGAATPNTLGIANVRHVAGGNQTAVLASDTTVWELNVSGTPSQTMTVQINSGQTLTTFATANLEAGGAMQLDGGTLDTQYLEILGGTLSGSGMIKTGSGPISGQVENRAGTVSPGNGIGSLEIDGSFANGTDGTLEIELGGLLVDTEFDQLVVDGSAALGGTLDISLVGLSNGVFDPQVGHTFEILTATEGVSGTFDTLILPAGYFWFVGYNANSVEVKVTVAGDFDGDLDADANDLSVWESGFGETNAYSGENFLQWQRGFNGGGSLAAATVVPEPGAAVLFWLAVGSGVVAWGRRPRGRR